MARSRLYSMLSIGLAVTTVTAYISADLDSRSIVLSIKEGSAY